MILRRIRDGESPDQLLQQQLHLTHPGGPPSVTLRGVFQVVFPTLIVVGVLQLTQRTVLTRPMMSNKTYRWLRCLAVVDILCVDIPICLSNGGHAPPPQHPLYTLTSGGHSASRPDPQFLPHELVSEVPGRVTPSTAASDLGCLKACGG
ncbi:putative FMRFamide receptor-like 3 [Homarus americanus]|uniref:Putative FMRFamide receptor-like 3 n=1 Tax=Homarus americanus TaxID=6706 RepID=A0A8J5N9K3_HOMAM|nr:putative FMRFamide receptor-like 3 [Homarus americanus]